MQIDQGVLRASVDESVLDSDPSTLGLVVLDRDGRVESANARARQLLGADAPLALAERLKDLPSRLDRAEGEELTGQAWLEGPGYTPVLIRGYAVGDRHVLLLRSGAVVSATTQALQHASRHRVFAFFARDWAHDLKGMLHVIRINGALLGRLLQRDAAPDAAVARCLEAIPREVERLDRSIELFFSAGSADRAATFDVGATCERVRQLVRARATRQRVEVALEMSGGAREITGYEDELQAALLNLAVNAIAAMPEQGHLLIQVAGASDHVTIRVCDTGRGMKPQLLSPSRPHFTDDGDRTGIGLFVTCAIVDAHGGRITCVSNVPQGTCIEITLPTTASTERLSHGSRTHR